MGQYRSRWSNISIFKYELIINNSKFESNTAKFGGAIYIYVDEVWDYEKDEEDEPIYDEKGEPIYHVYNTVNLTINKSKFSKNLAPIVINGNSYYQDENKTLNTSKQLTLDNSLKPTSLIKISANNFTTTFNSTKTTSMKLTYAGTNTPVQNFSIELKVTNNGTVKKYYVDAGTKGIATFKKASVLLPGTNIVEISSNEQAISFAKKTITIKIAKAKTTVKAPKVTNKYKKSKYFKITLKNKATKKVLKGIKIKLTVYTGKTYVNYTVKTNKKGIAYFNTKKLKKGTHKVIISSGNSNYTIYGTSSIKIK